MKIKPIYLVLALVALLLAACGAETPTPVVIVQTATPEIVPTEVPPTVSADPVWDRIVADGKIVVGTSADYQPFEYYDEDFENIIGFDAALMRNLAAQLGLELELVDIAFEGLPSALQISQIDAAIAAISVTPERQAMMDFSNVYYTGQDEILAKEGSGIPQITTAAELAPYRVGVQRGSVYATWLRNTLVNTGIMPSENLLEYDKAPEAVRDLRENRNDLVILDKLAADEFILSGDVVSVGKGLNTQLYAIALPKGASVLQEQINQALTELQNNGTVANLAETYLELIIPIEPEAQPTATVIPGPTPTPEECSDAMEFVRDVTIKDNKVISPSQNFEKVWRIRNTGSCTWTKDYKLVFVQGKPFRGETTSLTTRVESGNTYDLAIDMRAPGKPGKYTSFWQMVNADDEAFGERIYVKIRVPGAKPPTPLPPTATTVPPVQPTLAPGPVITDFFASAGTVNQGDLVVIEWSFSGQGLAGAKLNRTNPDGSVTPLFGGADVEPQGQYEDLMMSPGKYTYTLNVSAEFGGSAVQTVVVTVN